MLCSYENSSYVPWATCVPLIYLRRRGRKDPESSERSFNLFRVVWEGWRGRHMHRCGGRSGGLLWGTAHRYIRGISQKQGLGMRIFRERLEYVPTVCPYVCKQYATEWVEIWGLGLEGGFRKKEEHQLPPPCTTCSRFSTEKREIKVKSTFTWGTQTYLNKPFTCRSNVGSVFKVQPCFTLFLTTKVFKFYTLHNIAALRLSVAVKMHFSSPPPLLKIAGGPMQCRHGKWTPSNLPDQYSFPQKEPFWVCEQEVKMRQQRHSVSRPPHPIIFSAVVSGSRQRGIFGTLSTFCVWQFMCRAQSLFFFFFGKKV